MSNLFMEGQVLASLCKHGSYDDDGAIKDRTCRVSEQQPIQGGLIE